MEILTKRNAQNASCSFCQRDVSDVKFLFAQGIGTMCPECVVEVRKLMIESTESPSGEEPENT